MCLVLRLDRRGRGQCAAAAKRSEGSARGGGMLRGSTSKSRNPVIADEPPSSIAQKASFSLRFILTYLRSCPLRFLIPCLFLPPLRRSGLRTMWYLFSMRKPQQHGTTHARSGHPDHAGSADR